MSLKNLPVILIACLCATTTVAWSAESADEFLQRYFHTIETATAYAQIKQLYSPTKDDARNEEMLKKDPSWSAFFLAAIQGGEPTHYKILAKREAPSKVSYTLAPQTIPRNYAEESKIPGFAMTGEVVLVADRDGWRVYKDYWTVTSMKGGTKHTTSSGRNPDAKPHVQTR